MQWPFKINYRYISSIYLKTIISNNRQRITSVVLVMFSCHFILYKWVFSLWTSQVWVHVVHCFSVNTLLSMLKCIVKLSMTIQYMYYEGWTGVKYWYLMHNEVSLLICVNRMFSVLFDLVRIKLQYSSLTKCFSKLHCCTCLKSLFSVERVLFVVFIFLWYKKQIK